MNNEQIPKLSRQRRWQKRHPEKFKKIKDRYEQSEKGKLVRREYQRKYYANRRLEELDNG